MNVQGNGTAAGTEPLVFVDSGDPIANAQHHYNPSRDVVTRAEFIPENQFKVRS